MRAKGDNVDRLIPIIKQHLPAGHPFYDPDMISSEPERFFVSELIREQIFLLYSNEIPYSTAVRIETFKERPKHKDFISAVIV